MNYCWLTSPVRASGVLGRDDLVPTAFMLRHGCCGLTRPIAAVSHLEWEECIASGGCHFNLTSVSDAGRPLNLPWAFFMPEMNRGALVVGSALHKCLVGRCSFGGGCVVPLQAPWISAHAWRYVLPTSETEDVALYIALHEELGFSEPPGIDELLASLCNKWPAPEALPQMYALMPPNLLKHTGVRLERGSSGVVIRVGRDAKVRTVDGDIPATPKLFDAYPLLQCDGFLVPRSVADAFPTSRLCTEQSIDCMLDVRVEW